MLICGGSVALPGGEEPVRADLSVRDGKIYRIAQSLKPEDDEERVDASGLLVLPGGIDPHVHFDTPGFTYREDFLHGSAEAARGGITTVIDMPCTSLPPVTCVDNLRKKLAAVAPQALVDYAFYGGVRGAFPVAVPEDTALPPGVATYAMAELAPFVVGFKAYLLSGMDTFPRLNHEELGQALRQAARLGRPLLLHAEDADYVAAATARLKAARVGSALWSDYADSRPPEAELVAVSVALALARGIEETLHVVHVATAAAAELLSASGATCETCTHYLAFTRDDFAIHGSALKTAPPVKTQVDRKRLWELLAQGRIAFISSDHAPCQPEEKRTGSVWTDYGGIPGTGTLLPYLFSQGYLAGSLSLPRFLDAIAGAAARRYGLDSRKGSIAEGKDADFVLIDPAARTCFRSEDLYSKGRDTPFDGMELTGKVVSTWVRGKKVYDANYHAVDSGAMPGIRVQPGYGQFLAWGGKNGHTLLQETP